MSRGRVVSAIGGARDIEAPGRVRLVSVKKKEQHPGALQLRTGMLLC